MFIGPPVLSDLFFDWWTFFERNEARLDASDCSSVPNLSVPKTCGCLQRLMIAWSQPISEGDPIANAPTSITESRRRMLPNPGRPHKIYLAHTFDEDPFTDPNLITLHRISKENAEHIMIKKLIRHAFNDNIDQRFVKPLCHAVEEFWLPYSTRFSSTPLKVRPFHIQPRSDDHHVCLKLRNYSPLTSVFMKKMIDKIICHHYVYHNLSSPWTCAHSNITSKLCPAKMPAHCRSQPD